MLLLTLLDPNTLAMWTPTAVAGAGTLGLTLWIVRALVADINRQPRVPLPAWAQGLLPLHGRWLRYFLVGVGVFALAPFLFVALLAIVYCLLGSLIFAWVLISGVVPRLR